MNILYVGDIMGHPGIDVVAEVLPRLKKEHSIDLVIAQAENVTDGKGISRADYLDLKVLGIDCFTGGNWSLHRDDIIPFLNDPDEPIIRPANYPEGTPGLGYKYVVHATGSVLIISLLGKIVGKDSDKSIDNPLGVIDEILESEKATAKVATIVNFHGDFSSEKRIIGYYLDGRVTAVIGDHWHVPTADALVLPKGTAHITDVGMCGTLHSSLGVSFDSVVPRWKNDKQTLNVLSKSKPYQFNAVLVKTNDDGLASSIEQIQKVIP